MVKNHIKRLVAPKTWRVLRKETKFVTTPYPGGYPLAFTISINTFLKEMAGITKTTKESKYLLTKQEVQLNGKRIRDDKYPVGLMDIVTIPSAKKSFRAIIDNTGKLFAKELKEGDNTGLLQIIGKTALKKGQFQINTISGRNILTKEKDAKDYKVGDSLIVTFPDNKIKSHIKKEKGAQVIVYQGNHVGKVGSIEDIKDGIITIKQKKDLFETNSKYVFVVGKENAEIEVTE